MIIRTFLDPAINQFAKGMTKADKEKAKPGIESGLDLGQKLETAKKDLTALWENGEFQCAIYELDDQEIISMANKFQESAKNLMNSILDIVKAKKNKQSTEQEDITSLLDDMKRIQQQSEEINMIILDTQRLINKRLQEL
jgi:methyl-accepting chemotaxis protein